MTAQGWKRLLCTLTKTTQLKLVPAQKRREANNRKKRIPQSKIQVILILQPSSNISLIAFDLHSLEVIRGVRKEIIFSILDGA